MKKIFFIIVLFSFCLINLAAQTKEDSTNVQNDLKSMKEKVSLTDEQCQKIYPILMEFRLITQKDMANAGEDRMAMREIRRERSDKMNKAVNEVLTDEQKKLYEKYIEERRSQMRNNRGNNFREAVK